MQVESQGKDKIIQLGNCLHTTHLPIYCSIFYYLLDNFWIDSSNTGGVLNPVQWRL